MIPPPPTGFAFGGLQLASATGPSGVYQAIALNPAFAGWVGMQLAPALASAVGGLLVLQEHYADWTVRDSRGRYKTRGDEISGSDQPSPGKLSWPEQLRTHTEYKILDYLYDILKPGDSLWIEGIKSPCRACFSLMNKVAKQLNIRIFYEGGGEVHPFPTD
jgi:hypothetical protein